MKKTDRASVTLEATIGLIVFIAVSVTMAMIIRVVYIETIMQNALNQTATEIAANCYYLDVTGVRGGINRINETAQPGTEYVNGTIEDVFKATSQINETLSDVQGVSSSLKNGDINAALNDVNSVKDSFEELKGDTSKLIDRAKDISKNPIQSAKYLMQAALGKTTQALEGKVVEVVARIYMDKHLSMNGLDSDAFLKKKLVINGTAGLDFSGTKIFADGRSVDLVVRYQIAVPSPIKFISEFTVSQRAMANGWVNERKSREEGESVWEALSYTGRGKDIISKRTNLSGGPYHNYNASIKTGTIYKTMDLTQKTYNGSEGRSKSVSAVKSQIKQKVNAAMNFKETNDMSGNVVKAEDIDKTVITVIIPPKADKDQRAILDDAIKELKRDCADEIKEYNISFKIEEEDYNV